MREISLSPSMPDVTKGRPDKILASADYLLVVVPNVPSISGLGFIQYKFAMAIIEKQLRKPIGFITLERSPAADNVLCAFDNDGAHLNYGSRHDISNASAFSDAALDLARELFGIDSAREVAPKSKPRPWWKVW